MKWRVAQDIEFHLVYIRDINYLNNIARTNKEI